MAPYPEFRCRDRDGTQIARLSHAFPEVRHLVISFFEEVAECAADGVGLIFTRGQTVLLFEELLVNGFRDEFGMDPRGLGESDPRWLRCRARVTAAVTRSGRMSVPRWQKERVDMDERLRLMAVVCHPADAIDGAGGTLCLHSQRGDPVTVVVCTHGVDTHDLRRNDAIRFGGDARSVDQKAAMGRKEQEVIDGMRLLGVGDVRFLRFPDELLMVSQQLIEAIAEVMAEVQPHLLIVHNPTEEGGFADVGHADSAIAALKARYLANTPRFLKTPPGRYFPAQVFLMTMNGQTTQLTSEGTRHGNVLIDITPVIDLKVRALDCLHSQYYPGHVARKCIEIVNGRMGLHWCLPYAEAFQTLYPHGYSYLPANDHLMKLASTPASEHIKDLRIMVNDVPFEKEVSG